MFKTSRGRAVCEQTEDGPVADSAIPLYGDGGSAASPDDIILSEQRQPVAGEGSCLENNTCCGCRLSAPHTVGPFLKFWGLERMEAPPVLDPRFTSFGSGGAPTPAAAPPKFVWVGTVLVVTKATQSEVVVELQDAEGARQELLEGEVLDSYKGWAALRYRMRVPVAEEETKVHYAVSVGGKALHPGGGGNYHFYIAGSTQPTHWGFYSCSGFSADVNKEERDGVWKGLAPLWQDVAAVHEAKPLHLLVGGGDQLYCDDVWTLPSLKRFLDLPRKTEQQREDKRKSVYDDQMSDEVDDYYFHHYCCHFKQPVIADVYAFVPQIMTWDDHDIFDGWGSYPQHLQASNVFQSIFKNADRWYCVFQQHCRPEEKQPVTVYEVGSRTAIVACDQRQRRRKNQILPLEHYMEITNLCTNLPKGIEHVVFVSTVPVVYPHILGATPVLNVLRSGLLQCLLGSVGLKPMNDFGEPELLDDINDHWSTPNHHEERRFLIEHLQMLAKYRGCRVTLLSGDVHVCGAGKLISHPAPQENALRHDVRYMVQVISSAIANPPPPGGLMKVLDFFSWPSDINKNTRYSMMRIIKNQMGVRKALDNRRNWCEVLEHKTQADEQGLDGYLTFRLRVEQTPGSVTDLKTHDILVPPLEPLTPGTDDYFDVNSVAHQGCC